MQCPTGKAAFGYATAAYKARRASARYDQPMQHYRYATCIGWHIGSFIPKPRPLQTIRNNHDWRLL